MNNGRTDYINLANEPVMWLLCSVTVLVALTQAVLFMKAALRAADRCEIDPDIPKKAFRIGMITAVGPSIGVFIFLVSLMPVIGSPMAWMRLSTIGAALTVLSAANNGAIAAGVTMGGEGYTLEIFIVSLMCITLNGAGWLLFTGFTTPGLEKLCTKLSGGSAETLAVMTASCSIGIFSYLLSSSLITSGLTQGGIEISTGNLAAGLGAAAVMMVINKLICPRVPKLAEYSLGIAMVAGIIAGSVLG